MIRFSVVCTVTEDGASVGSERFTFDFPNEEAEELLSAKVNVNNISETQELCSGMARQAALSATWKAAHHFVGVQQRLEAELPPDLPIEPPH